jgi:DNA polymerase I-like protein with 3'-5' exonuclease and polymerase domains
MKTTKSPTGRQVESAPRLQNIGTPSPDARRVIEAFKNPPTTTDKPQPKAP